MSRFLLLNFEDFGLNQDITKTIQPFNPFCMCCLDREGPMFNLDKCQHRDFLDTFDKPQLKQFNQLVCLQCHSLLKKIKTFQLQILESYGILLSGAFTDTTINNKRLHGLIIQDVVHNLYLPPEGTEQLDPNIVEEQITNSIQNQFGVETHETLHEDFTHDVQNNSNIEDNFANELPSDSNIEDNFSHELPNDSNIEDIFTHDLPNDSNMEGNFTNELPNDSNMEDSFTNELPNDSNIEDNFTSELPNDSNIGDNFTNELPNDSNIEDNFTNELPNDSNLEDNFTHNITLRNNSNVEENYTQNVSTNSNMEESYIQSMPTGSNLEEKFNQQQNRLDLDENFTLGISNSTNMEENIFQDNRFHKNIKTALEILERNNQSFVTLSSQLQFLNGEHLSFLGPSLLSKEILTDIPLVPAKCLSTDLENGLMNNAKSLDIDIDGPEKMFYDSLDLSPDLIEKEAETPELIRVEIDTPVVNKKVEAKIKRNSIKPKKKRVRKIKKSDILIKIKTVKLSQDELNRERVLQAQSDAYLRFKFRCETCIVGFNYKENLEDHTKRKHGAVEGENVVCDICSQVILNPGSVTEHQYRHYTRYECVHCNRRYHTHDEAIRHCVRNQCNSG